MLASRDIRAVSPSVTGVAAGARMDGANVSGNVLIMNVLIMDDDIVSYL